MRKSIRGFSIIELVVVITIIGILATVSIMSYNTVVSKSRDSKREANVTAISDYLEKYYDSHGEYPSCAQMTQSASVVASEVLVGIDPAVLASPTATEGTNSISCSDITNLSDVYAYIGDGSTACLSGSSCLQYSLEYINQQNSDISVVNSKHEIDNTSLSPTNFANTSVANASATFSWTVSAFATGYTIQCALGSGFTNGVVSSSATGSTGTISGLTPNRDYYCRIRGTNSTTVGSWGSSITIKTTAVFGTIATATGLTESSIGATSSTYSWNSVTCNLGSPSYRVIWTAPSAVTGSWSSTNSLTTSNVQGYSYTWKVETKCTYDDLESSSSTSSTHSYSVPVSAPSGSWGSIGWNDRFEYNANSNSFTCVSPATKQYRLVMTLLDYTSGTWTFGWTTSSAISVTNANQGARMTVYFQVKCTSNSVDSSIVSSSSRTDAASVDAPGAIPGWCYGTCGSPKGDRWSAVTCPTGTYGVYWAYIYGDKLGALWGPYEAANFFGYDRPGYYDMINDYIKARCTSDFRSSDWGPTSYAYY